MHVSWSKALREGAVSGAVGSVLSTAALAAFSYRETGRPLAGINAVSHWYFHPQGLWVDNPSLQHTASGYAIHHAASMLWATVYAAGRQVARPNEPPGLPGALLTSALAAFVDLKLTPSRFTPGFEHRLSAPAMVAVYGSLALGLLVGASALHTPGQAR